MMEPNFSSEVEQCLKDGETLRLPVSEIALLIVLKASKYRDGEVGRVLSELQSEIAEEIRSMVSDYRETGEYHLISSAGAEKDLSELMSRISQLI